jgi:hypothetical protein
MGVEMGSDYLASKGRPAVRKAVCHNPPTLPPRIAPFHFGGTATVELNGMVDRHS